MARPLLLLVAFPIFTVGCCYTASASRLDNRVDRRTASASFIVLVVDIAKRIVLPCTSCRGSRANLLVCCWWNSCRWKRRSRVAARGRGFHGRSCCHSCRHPNLLSYALPWGCSSRCNCMGHGSILSCSLRLALVVVHVCQVRQTSSKDRAQNSQHEPCTIPCPLQAI